VIIPNYVPEPIEVPGNVHDLPYRHRVEFNRQVIFRFAASLTLAQLASGVVPKFDPVWMAAIYLGWTIILGLFRILFRSQTIESRVTGASLGITVGLLSLVLATIPFDARPLAFASIGLAIYAEFSRRDFSYPQAWLWGALGLVLADWLLGGTSGRLALAHVCLWYYVIYDIWCIQYRRRYYESWAGANDVFRDFMNFWGWLARVAAHWKKYGLWRDVQEDITRRLNPES
jgi:hypothetical protein